MYPPFGKSNIYFRVRDQLKKMARHVHKKVKSLRYHKPTLGRVWLRLSYFEERLKTLDDDSQEIFIENFYNSMRQVNYMTLLTVFVIVATYLTVFHYGLLAFWEGLVIEVLLVFTLFYMVWYYRLGMEDLLDYLIRTETTPDYAFRPRLAPAGYRPARPAQGRKARKPRKR